MVLVHVRRHFNTAHGDLLPRLAKGDIDLEGGEKLGDLPCPLVHEVGRRCSQRTLVLCSDQRHT